MVIKVRPNCPLLHQTFADGLLGVTSCSDAFQALQLIKENTYHVALCDVLMPGMDGLALLTEIRKLPHAHEMSVISMFFISHEMLKFSSYLHIFSGFRNGRFGHGVQMHEYWCR